MSEAREESFNDIDATASLSIGRQNGIVFTAASTLAGLVNKNTNAARSTDDHDYEDDEEENESKEFNIPDKLTKSGRKRAIPFPLKLMKVLSCKDYEHIIGWSPSGKSFSIKKPKVFTAEILPTYFKTAKYSSFTRKLHRWGFMRHYRGIDAGSFFHNDFQKDRLDLVEQMSCYKVDTPKNATPQALQDTDENVVEESNNSLLEEPNVPTLMPKTQRTAVSPSVDDSITAESRKRQSSMEVASVMAPRMEPQFNFQRSNTNFSQSALPVDLNAAIEAEVSRRINERIKAATIARDALEILRQQVKPLMPNNLLTRNHMQFGNQVPMLPTQGGFQGGFDARTALSLAASRGYYKPPPINFAALDRRMASPHGSMPGANIQGAKTA